MRHARLAVLAMVLLTTCAGGAPAADLLIRGAKLWPVTAGPTVGSLLVRDGKIAAVGGEVTAPAGARIIEAAGQQVCPGFIDARSHLGLPRHESDETVEAFDVDLCVAGACYWPGREDVKQATRSGVTLCLLTPGGADPLGGRCLLAKPAGTFPGALPGVTQITLSQAVLQWNRAPTSWSGLLTRLREVLAKLGPEARTVQFVCDGRVEAQQAVALAKEFSLHGTVFVSRPSLRLPEAVAGSGLTVVLPVLLGTPLDSAQGLAGALAARQVPLAFGSEAPYNDPADLRTCAALAVGAGLAPEVALRALTLDAARALGVGERVGSLEVGKDADLLVLGGDPLDLQAPVDMVITDGVVAYERGARP